jgi:hypothetical protein
MRHGYCRFMDQARTPRVKWLAHYVFIKQLQKRRPQGVSSGAQLSAIGKNRMHTLHIRDIRLQGFFVHQPDLWPTNFVELFATPSVCLHRASLRIDAETCYCAEDLWMQ